MLTVFSPPMSSHIFTKHRLVRSLVVVLITLFKAAILVSTALLLGACVPKFAVKSDTSERSLEAWRTHQATVATIRQWELKGKVGVKTGTKGGSATLKWNYTPGKQDIELYGPFGGGRVIINATQDGARLKDTKGKIVEGDTPESVLYQRLGWRLPFNRLVMWSRGLPNDDAIDLEFDTNGYLSAMKEDIWSIEYQEYQQITGAAQTHTLPRKLTITALPGKLEIYDDDGNYLGDHLSVKVILKRWWDVASGE